MNLQGLLSRLSAPLLVGVMAITYTTIVCAIIDTPFISILLASTLTFALFIHNVKLFKNRKYAYIFIGITILKLILLILNAKYKFPLMAGVDWINYDTYARDAINGNETIIEIFNGSIDLFVFLMAMIYKIFGANVEQIYFYIFPLSLLLVRYIHKTASLLTAKRGVADKAALLMTAWPVDIIFSIALLREMPIQLLMIASFYNFVKYYHYKKTISLVLAFILIFMATLMHSGMIGIFLVYLYALLQQKMYKRVKIVKIGALIVVSIAAIILTFTPIWESMSKRFATTNTESGVITALENQEKYLGDAATNYVQAPPQDILGVVTSIPYRFTMFALAPLPWQVHDLGTLISFTLDGTLQIGIIYLIIRIYRNRGNFARKKKDMGIVITMCIIVTYLIFSLGTTNYGTAMRHRTKVLPLVIVLISTFEVGRRRKA